MNSHKEDLEHAINKWQKNCESKVINASWKSCVLCTKYLCVDNEWNDDSSCNGCPIFQWNNKRYCLLTPYDQCSYMARTLRYIPFIDPCV